MKRNKIVLAVICVFFFVPFGCQKDNLDQDLSENYDTPLLPREGDQNIFITGGGATEDTSANITTLGPARENPYTVENFTAAYNELYNPDVASLLITHYYIKFTPTTHEDLDLLANSELNIVEFPLDREITHLGDFYLESGTPRDQILPLYSVVKPSELLPQVPYTILANLYLGSNDETLVRRALQRKGYNPDDIGFTIEPPYDGDGGGGGGSLFTTNSCGCQVYTDIRRPGGCIQVKDKEMDTFQGVRRVKVVIKDNFFEFHTVYTDDSGCWKLNNRFFGKAYMWVQFKSESRVKIRGAKSSWASLLEWVFTLNDHVGTLNGPMFNNIQVKYDIWTVQGSAAHLYWGASTVGNAVHDFYDFAAIDGINNPPSKLDIYVARNRTDGYTLMAPGQIALAEAISIGLTTIFSFTGPFAPILGFIAGATTIIYLPDVMVGINFTNSDRLKQVAYHELAHSSHFTNVSHEYWISVVWDEIIAGGHGGPNSLGANLIALVESWAEHIGLTYTGRKYFGFPQNPPHTLTWLSFLERIRNETANHIPVGFYHDLSDNVPDTNNGCEETDFTSCGPINDQASGFTISQMFDLLDVGSASPLQFKDRLIDGLNPTVQTQVNDLFNSY